jgi:hypothetical protein
LSIPFVEFSYYSFWFLQFGCPNLAIQTYREGHFQRKITFWIAKPIPVWDHCVIPNHLPSLHSIANNMTSTNILCYPLRSLALSSLNATPQSNYDPLPDRITAGTGRFEIQLLRLSGGRSDGMECLRIHSGAVEAIILPDRGMGLWKCWADGMELGWQSPVVGPVRPELVPVHDASGIGWLEGFDELLVRCGLFSNGAPEFHSNGTVLYPLHGRIANLPAHQLEVQVDVENGILDVIGFVREARFLIYSLELETRYRFRVGSPVIEVIDTVTNRSSQRGSMQLLYHINLGQPILQAGSKIHVPFRKLVPRNQRATEGIEKWNACDGPASGFQEQVYLMTPAADDHHWTAAEDVRFTLTLERFLI